MDGKGQVEESRDAHIPRGTSYPSMGQFRGGIGGGRLPLEEEEEHVVSSILGVAETWAG